MKKIHVFVMITLISTCNLLAQKGKISDAERTFLINYLEVTEKELLSTLEKVDAEAWEFRPSDGGWTVAECMDHLLLAEVGVFGQVKTAMADEPNPDLSTRNQDAWLISKIADRGAKVNTPLPPREVVRDSKTQMIEKLRDSRKMILEYLKNKDLELRTHFGKSPNGPADAYQLLLVIAGHSMRHHGQIIEILSEIEAN